MTLTKIAYPIWRSKWKSGWKGLTYLENVSAGFANKTYVAPYSVWSAITTVEGVEGKVNRHSHRWYSFRLYIYLVIQLPLSAAVEEDKVAKFRLSLAYRESQDPLVKAAITAVSQAECSFKTRENPRIRRQRHGISHFQLCLKSSPKQERVMIQREVQSLEDEGRRAKGNEHRAQGTWTKWGPLRRNITWAEQWRLEPFLISFLLRAVYAQVGGEGVVWRQRNHIVRVQNSFGPGEVQMTAWQGVDNTSRYPSVAKDKEAFSQNLTTTAE